MLSQIAVRDKELDGMIKDTVKLIGPSGRAFSAGSAAYYRSKWRHERKMLKLLRFLIENCKLEHIVDRDMCDAFDRLTEPIHRHS